MLKVRDFSVSFADYSSGVKTKPVSVITSLDIEVKAGEIMAVVGQSGAGKSLLAHAILGILPRNTSTTGKIYFKGRSLTARSIKQLRGKEIALIPQSVTYLNPLVKVGTQIARAARLSGLKRREAERAAHDSLGRYLLEEHVAASYPFQLSGGMARRILTATATVGMADLLIADEPTNGLDSVAVEETLDHLRELADLGKAVLLITHDLQSVLKVADKVTVLNDGVTLEIAKAADFNGHSALRHPYTMALWDSLPANGFSSRSSQRATQATERGGSCPYQHDCHKCDSVCAQKLPELREFRGGWVRCHNA